jgi:hypothetical protein
MLQESLNKYFIISAIAVGVISILINWFYIIETSKGIYITEFYILKKYVNLSFDFSMAMLIILWVTTDELESLLLKCFWGLTIGWILTIMGTLVVPEIMKGGIEDKKNIRKILWPCIVKVVIIVAVLWLIY